MEERSTDVPNPSTDVPNPSTDVLNPSAEVNQATTCLLLFLTIYQRGEHNIEYQLTFAGSNFIFHDSRGIEAGSESELKIVKEFIRKREGLVDLRDQLHVIWWVISILRGRHDSCYMPTGTVSQWMINVQSLGLNRLFSVLELAEVFFSFFFCTTSDAVIFSSTCGVDLHQV